jgi:hypothetical protein
MRIVDIGGTRILFVEEGPVISAPEDASDLIGTAWFEHVGVIGLPVDLVDPRFFDLSSGFAGELAQKAVNYRVVLALIGDVTDFEARSSAFRDFVWESNRGTHVWFVPDEKSLAEKLAAKPA